MSRISRKQKKIPQPDPVYNSRLVTLLVSGMLKSGKKSLSQKIVYQALKEIGERTRENPVSVVHAAVKNVAPRTATVSRRLRGKISQIPIKVRAYRGTKLSVKWISEFAKVRAGGKTISQRLAGELIAASQKKGKAFRKKEQVHKLAAANKHMAFLRRKLKCC